MPGTSAQRMLTGGTSPLRLPPPASAIGSWRSSIGVLPAARATTPPTRPPRASRAHSTPTSPIAEEVADLLVVGSSPATPKGRVELTARADYAIETANSPVIAVPRGTQVKFSKPGIVERVAAKV